MDVEQSIEEEMLDLFFCGTTTSILWDDYFKETLVIIHLCRRGGDGEFGCSGGDGDLGGAAAARSQEFLARE